MKSVVGLLCFCLMVVGLLCFCLIAVGLSCKMVASWLVKLLGSVPDLTVTQADIMSIGCGLKENCGRVS
jgi:hypothetical protein